MGAKLFWVGYLQAQSSRLSERHSPGTSLESWKGLFRKSNRKAEPACRPLQHAYQQQELHKALPEMLPLRPPISAFNQGILVVSRGEPDFQKFRRIRFPPRLPRKPGLCRAEPLRKVPTTRGGQRPATTRLLGATASFRRRQVGGQSWRCCSLEGKRKVRAFVHFTKAPESSPAHQG